MLCAIVLQVFVWRASLIADELPAVESFELGPFTLHVATKPFRVSWYHNGSLLIAERARRVGSSMEVLGDAGWTALGDVLAFHKEDDRVTVDVAVPGSKRTAKVHVSAGLSVELPGARGVRDDLIPSPEEVFFMSSGAEPVVFSSRGYAIRASAGGKARVKVFEPDPDALRFESGGHQLACEFWPVTSPKDALRRSACLRAATPQPAAPPAPRAISEWAQLRAALTDSLESSLAGETLAPIVPAPESNDVELVARIRAIAAFLPALYSPPAKSAGSDRLEKARDALEPLLAKHAALAKEEGIAALRPLFVENPEEHDAWRVRDEWMLGPDVLVAPILKQGVATRDVWLPPGEWVNARAKLGSAPSVRGPTRLKVDIAPGGIAIYVRREATESFAKLLEATAGE